VQACRGGDGRIDAFAPEEEAQHPVVEHKRLRWQRCRRLARVVEQLDQAVAPQRHLFIERPKRCKGVLCEQPERQLDPRPPPGDIVLGVGEQPFDARPGLGCQAQPDDARFKR